MHRFVIMNVVNRFKYFIDNVFIQLRFFYHLNYELNADALNAIFEVLHWFALCISTYAQFAEVSIDKESVQEGFKLVSIELDYLGDVRLRLDVIWYSWEHNDQLADQAAVAEYEPAFRVWLMDTVFKWK